MNESVCGPMANTMSKASPRFSLLPASNNRNGAHMPGSLIAPPADGSTVSRAPLSAAGQGSMYVRTGPWA